MKVSQREQPVPSGAISACEDESCSLLPAMRRFIETGVSEEWTPTDMDVTLTMDFTRDRRGRLVTVHLEVDNYNWIGTTAYSGTMVRFEFECTAEAFERFYNDLRAEFVVFREVSDIAAINASWGFDRPEHDWF